jgi:XTP/dITP diphosphohydrolase
MNGKAPGVQKVELVIASTNVHKIREFKSILKPLAGLDLRSLSDFPEYAPPAETGKTFAEIAQAKAEHAAKALGRWVVADDSGLVVPALGGAPGVLSARYAGNDATSADNRKKLLEAMQHLLDDDRSAYFECALALASPAGLKKTVKGICEGIILPSEKGGSGFGYDSLFVKHGYHKTFAELGEALKNRVSHRRKAIDKLMPWLEELLVLLH